MAVTTILYDLGRTLVNFDFTPIYATLSERSGKTPDEAKSLVHQRYAEFTCGRMSGREWHVHIMKTFGISMPFAEFAHLWADIFWANDPMIGLAGRLHARHRSYLLSNTDEIHLPWCRDRFALDSFLDGMILSYEIGAMKPDHVIYEVGLRKFGLAAEGCVFIDDLPENLEGARSYGIHTVLCETAEQVERDLAALGVRTDDAA